MGIDLDVDRTSLKGGMKPLHIFAARRALFFRARDRFHIIQKHCILSHLNSLTGFLSQDYTSSITLLKQRCLARSHRRHQANSPSTCRSLSLASLPTPSTSSVSPTVPP